MAIEVRIPTILRSYTGGAAEVTAADGTLRDVIAGLVAVNPRDGSVYSLGVRLPSLSQIAMRRSSR